MKRGEGSVTSVIGVDPGEYYTWGFFCELAVNLGMCVGPVRGLSSRR